jgi:ribosome-associated protein
MLAMTIANAALEKKALDLVVLDLRTLTTFTDFFVVCSGTSDRQVQTIGRSIEDTLRLKKRKPLGVEGYENGHWVLIDYGDVVAHVFYHLDREHYQLEKLWSDAPHIKI